jgi:hypothetical protein
MPASSARILKAISFGIRRCEPENESTWRLVLLIELFLLLFHFFISLNQRF